LRAFVALFPPPEARHALAEATAALRARGLGMRWTAAEQLHLTLSFLGEIDPGRGAEYEAALHGALASVPAAGEASRWSALGTFPPAGAVRVLWAGITGGDAALRALAAAVATALRPLGHEPEPRPFTPHVTLARARGRGADPRLQRSLADCRLPAAPFRFARLGLYRSETGAGGSRYAPVVELAWSP
jgi:2'-5' RNA ligase